LGTRIREGIGFVRHDPYLPWMTVIGGLANFGLTGMGALQVLFLVDHLGLTPSGVGVVMMVGSSGGLLGAAAAAWCSRRLGSGRAFRLMTLGSGFPALLVPLAWPGTGASLVAAGLFLIGVFAVAGNVVRAAWRQAYVPAPLMGRVVTSIQFVNFGTMPVAGVLAGWLGSALGVRETIAVMAAVHVGGSLLVLASPLRGRRDLPAPAASPDC